MSILDEINPRRLAIHLAPIVLLVPAFCLLFSWLVGSGTIFSIFPDTFFKQERFNLHHSVYAFSQGETGTLIIGDAQFMEDFHNMDQADSVSLAINSLEIQDITQAISVFEQYRESLKYEPCRYVLQLSPHFLVSLRSRGVAQDTRYLDFIFSPQTFRLDWLHPNALTKSFFDIAIDFGAWLVDNQTPSAVNRPTRLPPALAEPDPRLADWRDLHAKISQMPARFVLVPDSRGIGSADAPALKSYFETDFQTALESGEFHLPNVTVAEIELARRSAASPCR